MLRDHAPQALRKLAEVEPIDHTAKLASKGTMKSSASERSQEQNVGERLGELGKVFEVVGVEPVANQQQRLLLPTASALSSLTPARIYT